MHSRNAKISVFAFVLALAVAGCGGGGDETALTKAQFVKQADAICEKADNARYKELARAIKGVSSPQGLPPEKEDSILVAGLEPVQKQAEELRELGAPEGDEEQIERYLDELEEAVKEAEAGTIVALEKRKNAFTESDELAEEYGFKVCKEAL